ncbi:MAG TPA: hypothetical protein VF432_19940 [Thermoanaerobaculia bacterium]
MLVCLSLDAVASTIHDFDTSGTSYSLVHADYGSNPAPATILPGGPTGNFLRLATTPAVNLNTIAFAGTDRAANEITADFDFRMIPPSGGRSAAADGFGFALLNNGNWGTSGGVFSSVPEMATLAGSLGVGFRIYNANAITIAFNGSQLASFDVTPIVDLCSGQFIHTRIVMRPGAGFSDVTVILTPPGGSPTTVVDRYAVAGFTPYAGRVWFGARSGGLSAQHDLDNINVQFSVPPDLPFVQLLKAPAMRFVSYSPTNFNPSRTPGGALLETPPQESVTNDLIVLRPAFNGLILYGTQMDAIGGGHQLVPWIVSEARRLGYRAIVLGVWNPRDDAEVDAAAALVNQHAADPGQFAVAVCLGNEGILRGEYTIADLDAARARLLSQTGAIQVPIVTSEDYARYSSVPALRAWGTFLFPIIVPHWNQPGLGPADAAAWVRQAGAALADQAQSTVLVKEAGFPSGGAAPYTPETQRQFFAAYFAGPSFVDSTQIAGVFTAYTTVLEAYDQYWKAYPDFTTWGLLGRNRAAKPAYQVFLAFTDDPLVPRVHRIRAMHVIELRTRIDALRVRSGLGASSWTGSTLTAGSTRIRAVHVLDLRNALTQTYNAKGLTPPSFTDPDLAAGTAIKATHFAELRAAVMTIE